MASELPPPPSISDTLLVDLFKLPLTCVYGAVWTLRFRVLRQEYGEAEKAILTARALGMSAAAFARLSEEEREENLGLELWVPENLDEFISPGKGEKSGKEKRAARQRKKNPTPMNLGD